MGKNVRMVMFSAVSAVLGGLAAFRGAGKIIYQNKKMSDKHLALFLMMDQWVKVKQDGKMLGEYFKRYGYQRIAVYGMSYAGETLCRELKDSGIEIVYGIDQNADVMCKDIEMKKPEEELPQVDAVVVTVVYYFDAIEETLKQKVDCPILSLGDIVYEV